MSRETVWLQRSGEDIPWGFRLQGGRDHQEPLRVHKVFSGSVAARDLSAGDQVLRIGDTDTSVLTFNQAQDIVKTAGNVLQLLVSKGSTDSGEYQPQPSGQYGGAPTQYGGPPGAPETGHNFARPPPGPGGQPAMPDAVLNMAAKGAPDKKPWAYAPDLSSIKEQRDKVRRSNQPQADAMLSPTFRAVHGLDGQQPKFPVRAPQAHQRVAREPAADDEMTFTGYNRPDEIPSKSFHRLQQNIGGSDIDTSSIRHNVSGEPENDIGNYDEASIRYRGRNIPSKSFRMLQNMTGGSQLNVPHVNSASTDAPGAPTPTYGAPASPKTEPAPTGTPQGKPPRRRRQREPKTEDEVPSSVVHPAPIPGQHPTPIKIQQPAPIPVQQPWSEPKRESFDENAFLAGKIPILGGSGETKVPPRATVTVTEPKDKQPEDEPEKHFDENDYLQGKMTLWGDQPTPRDIRERTPDQPVPWRKRAEVPDEPTRYFDEDTFLRNTARATRPEETPEWIKHDEEKEAMYDERAYLLGRIPLVSGGDPDLTTPLPEPDNVHERYEGEDEQKQQFDEGDYLSGKLSLYGESTGPARPTTVKEKSPPPPYVRSEEPEAEYDEHLFLEGKVALVRSSIDVELTRPFQPADPKHAAQAPVWASRQDSDVPEDLFDEDMYLRTGAIQQASGPVKETPNPDQGYRDEPPDSNVPDEMFDETDFLTSGEVRAVPSKKELEILKEEKKEIYRPRAPWEKGNMENENDESDFDENAYLCGRVSVGRCISTDRDLPKFKPPSPGGFKAIPSKAFMYLTRSVSREASREGSPSTGPYGVLRQTSQPATVDVENALNKMDIESQTPDQYLQALKETAEEEVKAEYEDEVTDF